ncbi:MAG: DUF3137 domain-containing protein [Akkermansiaceae bacterium]
MSRWDIDRALATVANELQGLEQIRQEVLAERAKGKQKLIFVIAGALVVALLAMAMAGNPLGLLAGVAVGLIGGLIINHIYFAKGASRYQSMFKNQFVSKVVKAIEPGMNYDPHQGISKGTFSQSGLFSSSPDRYSCEDLFHGKIGETDLMFSEVHAEDRRTRRNSDGKTQTYYVTIFKGIFFIADFHKHFRSTVSVEPDLAERHLGWIGKKLQKLGGNLQKLENPEFEKMYVVRGKDPVEARYILTPSMQGRLVELGKRVGNGLKVVFRDSQVYLAIPNKEDWFEGNLHKPAGDRNQAAKLLSELKSCFIIVDELDLNTRIWTKE